MSHDPSKAYLETNVLTAAPERLRLMLIEGAMRFVIRAQQEYASDRSFEASEAVGRAREIITELLVTIPAANDSLHRTVRGIYAFMYRELAETQLLRSPERLAGVIQVLEEERETWRLFCEREQPIREFHAPEEQIGAPMLALDSPVERFSLEA